MLELFKERKFNDYINDTFTFFKECGKHFFKNFLTINGIPMVVALVIIYFFSKIYFEFIFSRLSPQGIQENSLNNYIAANFGLVAAIALFCMLLFILITILQFAFPVVYLDLYDQKKGTDFTATDVLNGIKKRTSKILKFIIGLIFVISPLLMIVFVINIFLCFIIIGIPLFLITIPALMSFVHLSFFYYMNSETGFFRALSDAFETIKGQFWAIVLSTLVIFFIYYMVSAVITMVPYFFGMANLLTNPNPDNQIEQFSTLSIMMTIVMIASTLVNFILQNLILINQGMIYYSHIENTESTSTKNSIDLIGSDNE